MKTHPEANNEAYLISKGVRDVAMLTVNEDEVDGVKDAARRYDLHCLVTKMSISADGESSYIYLNGELLTGTLFVYHCYLYKEPHLKPVIQYIESMDGMMHEWALGKLLGYSEASIGEFLRKLGMVK